MLRNVVVHVDPPSVVRYTAVDPIAHARSWSTALIPYRVATGRAGRFVHVAPLFVVRKRTDDPAAQPDCSAGNASPFTSLAGDNVDAVHAGFAALMVTVN